MCLFLHKYIVVISTSLLFYGASRVQNLLIVCGEIRQPLDAKMRQPLDAKMRHAVTSDEFNLS